MAQFKRMHSRDRTSYKWAGTATLGAGWAAFCGAAGDHAAHRHHAVQIAIGIDAPVQLWTEARGSFRTSGVVIAAGELHCLASSEHPVQLLYFERQSAWGRLLEAWCGPGSRVIGHPQTELALQEVASSGSVAEGVRRALESIVGSATSACVGTSADARIARVIEHAAERLPSSSSINELARVAALSPSRLAHLFRAEAGMPIRPYLRWLRLQRAVHVVASGQNLTAAAHGAGFSDSAHLSRTFRRHFGVPPSVLFELRLALAAADVFRQAAGSFKRDTPHDP